MTRELKILVRLMIFKKRNIAVSFVIFFKKNCEPYLPAVSAYCMICYRDTIIKCYSKVNNIKRPRSAKQGRKKEKKIISLS